MHVHLGASVIGWSGIINVDDDGGGGGGGGGGDDDDHDHDHDDVSGDTINEACSSNAECGPTKNVVCFRGRCLCKSGYFLSESRRDGQICLESKLKFVHIKG